MRAANGTGANRATTARIREAVAALGAEDARRYAELLAQAEADLDEAFELLESAGAQDLIDAGRKVYGESLRRWVIAVNEGADEAENQDAHFRSALGDA
jgi:hypothetical protein